MKAEIDSENSVTMFRFRCKFEHMLLFSVYKLMPESPALTQLLIAEHVLAATVILLGFQCCHHKLFIYKKKNNENIEV